MALGYYKGKHYTEYKKDITKLKSEGLLDEASNLLINLIHIIEKEDKYFNIGVPPWYYEQLAIIYRKQKKYDAEVAILERFARKKHGPGAKSQQLLERLEKAKILLKNYDLINSTQDNPPFKKTRPVVTAIIDIETTGLNPHTEEVIEFAIILFSFDQYSGELIKIEREYTGLREPSVPIQREASRVNGITYEMVQGHELNNHLIEEIIDKAEFLIAHNASFERGFLEKLFPISAKKTWYCSMNGVDWKSRGFKSKALQNLLQSHNIKVDKQHRALDDAKATMELLLSLDSSGEPYICELLNSPPHEQRKRQHKSNYSTVTTVDVNELLRKSAASRDDLDLPVNNNDQHTESPRAAINKNNIKKVKASGCLLPVIAMILLILIGLLI